MALKVTTHRLVPKHSKVSDSDKQKVLKELGVSTKQLPKILSIDPAILDLKVKVGDLVKVERISATCRTAIYYRVVIDG